MQCCSLRSSEPSCLKLTITTSLASISSAKFLSLRQPFYLPKLIWDFCVDEPGIMVGPNTLPFLHFSISAPTLTYHDAWNRRDAPRELRALSARFSLSLYCSQRLYSVTSRRGSNDQWLGRSLKQAGQMLIAPSARHVSVVLPFKSEFSTAPLTIFLACILYFCHLFPSTFSTVSQHLRRDLGRAHLVIGFIAPLGTQVRWLVIFNSCDLFHFISKCVKIVSSWSRTRSTVVSPRSLHAR